MQPLPQLLRRGLAALAVLATLAACAPADTTTAPAAPSLAKQGQGNVTLAALSVGPGAMPANSTTQGTVTLGNPAPAGGAVVSLASDKPAAASVPASVTVPQGQTSAKFTITAGWVGSNTLVAVTATLGRSTRVAQLTVMPAEVVSISMRPDTVAVGTTTSGTVMINTPAPAGGVTISITSSDDAVARGDAAVVIPPGQTSATFPVWGFSPGSVTMTATLGASSRTTRLTVRSPE